MQLYLPRRYNEGIHIELYFPSSNKTAGKWSRRVNPLTNNVPHHIETTQLICNVNQLTS